MRSCIFIAASALFALASGKLSWTYDSEQEIYNTQSVKINLSQRGDLAFSTVYEAGNNEEDPKWHDEAYGLRVWLNTSFVFDIELFNFYKRQIHLTVNVFDITPYKQIISWYRPEHYLAETVFDKDNQKEDFFDVKLIGTYSVSLLELRTAITENAKTLKYSLIDVLENPDTAKPYPDSVADAKASLAFNGKYDSEYEDDFLNIDFLKVFGIDLYTSKYYGKGKVIYRYSILHEDQDDDSDELLNDIINKIKGQ